MSNDILIGAELGPEFDQGIIQSGKVRLKIGTGLSIAPDGTISRSPITYYEKIVIWAEEGAAIANNSNEWSFGNGAAGNIGITVAEDWEMYAISFNADVSSVGALVTMDVMNRVTGAAILNQAIPNNGISGNYHGFVDGLSVGVSAGDVLGFRTSTIVGTMNDARVAIYLRRAVII